MEVDDTLDQEDNVYHDEDINREGTLKMDAIAESQDRQSHRIDLPRDSLVIFPHPEKDTKYPLGAEDYMPMSDSRILLSGMPGSGKRNVILNIIYRMRPVPSVVHLVHSDPYTMEYDCISDDLGVQVLKYSPHDFPTVENIDCPLVDDPYGVSVDPYEDEGEGDEGDRGHLGAHDPTKKRPLQNPVVIVDEVTSDQLGKEGCIRMERMINHVATHRNTAILCSIQSLVNIPPKARRGFNHMALWRQADDQVNQLAATRCGIPFPILKGLFGCCETHHDFIWVDLDRQRDSEWRYRLNFVSPILIHLAGTQGDDWGRQMCQPTQYAEANKTIIDSKRVPTIPKGRPRRTDRHLLQQSKVTMK